MGKNSDWEGGDGVGFVLQKKFNSKQLFSIIMDAFPAEFRMGFLNSKC